MTTAEILAKLEGTLSQEGVKVEALRESGENLYIRAQRVAPGVPVAFLVKAIAGTLRRYHETLREVVLEEYDPGEGIPTPQEPSPEFQKVLNHKPQGAPGRLQDIPGLDLRGLDRAEAVRALETAHRIWSAQGHTFFLVRGIEEDPVGRAWDKWWHHYDLVRSSLPENVDGVQALAVTLKTADKSGTAHGRTVMWMPARVLLVEGPLEG